LLRYATREEVEISMWAVVVAKARVDWPILVSDELTLAARGAI